MYRFILFLSSFKSLSAYVENTCEVEPKYGPGEDQITRYFANYKSRKCEQFFWGGEEPNTNNFETYDDCRSTCPEHHCDLAWDVGPCSDAITRWYFNTKTLQCETFVYGGCEGNANNFESLAQCVESCPEEPCLQPMQHGNGTGFMERFFYNQITEECEPFYFSGCDGNRNNFESIRSCEAICNVRTTLCRQEKKIGTCTVFQPKIWYNGPVHKCEPFNYSGCQKNANNFESVDECKKMCMPYG